MYNVVFRTIADCASKGAITWTSFNNKRHFDEWFDAKMRNWYEIVEEGVSPERAVELSSSPEAIRAVFFSRLRKLGEALRNI